ncbi:SH3 domain-containing protein [Fusibacter ferrireducens]|uniref:SH3 domain-containing protein n=1 Tax=Fusibacter ferrireducens TaxID=2785058 RepID=A0ABS0A052_9FIRM|nr:SH3 domain-containing protein [Fusibacter ferrireducens]MBF4696077.1 hypothetical protein [Fusibacter ferrireducens]
MIEYKVIKERKSDMNSPIKLEIGDIVECLEESDEDGDWAGWIFCKGNSLEGWVPTQIIKKEGKIGKVLENYDATEFDLTIGEIIISDKELNGWIYGIKKNSDGLKAWAPLNHIQKL